MAHTISATTSKRYGQPNTVMDVREGKLFMVRYTTATGEETIAEVVYFGVDAKGEPITRTLESYREPTFGPPPHVGVYLRSHFDTALANGAPEPAPEMKDAAGVGDVEID